MIDHDLVEILKTMFEKDRRIMVDVDAGIVDPATLDHPIELIKREVSLIQELLYLQDIKEARNKNKEGR